MARQKASAPPSVACQTTAANGSRTMRLIQAMTIERERSAGSKLTRAPGRAAVSGRGATRPRLLGGDAMLALNLGHDAVGRVEELGGHIRPATQVGDREERRWNREAGSRGGL